MKNPFSRLAVVALGALLSTSACDLDEQPFEPVDTSDPCDGDVCPCTTDDCGTTTLTVLRSGSGSGTVVSTPAGIHCGTDCSLEVETGTIVLLTPAPDDGSRFVEWKGACSGDSSCRIKVNAPTTVEAVFERDSAESFVLTVAKSGAGVGTVRSTPSGIDCGSSCSASFPYDATVVLTALPGNGSSFTGWSGACSGTGTCTVTMSAARSVTANFVPAAPTSHRLTVSRTGSGTVTSSPSGINCGSTCSAQMPIGSVVTLTATPAANATFTGWGGACSGTGPCSVTMTGDRTVSARFETNNSGTLDSFGNGGCAWLDPDSTSRYIGVIPQAAIVLPSGSIRIGGIYVSPMFGSQPSFEPWYAAFASNGVPEIAFGPSSQLKVTAQGVVDVLDVTSAGPLISLGSGVPVRLTSSSIGRVQALPTDLVDLAGASGDALVAVNASHLYRVTDVIGTGGGSLDTTFGSQGSVAIELPAKAISAGITGSLEVERVLVDASNRTYVIGTAMEGSSRRLLAMRYDATGALDTSFEQGVAIFPEVLTRTHVDAAFDAAKSRLVITAVTAQGIVAHRIVSSAIDSSFGSGGTAVVAPNCWWPLVAVLADGRTMVAGSCSGVAQLRRLLANGQLDTTYNGTGVRSFSGSFFPREAEGVSIESLAVTSTGATLVLLAADRVDDPRGALCKLKP